jgi:hypothetical protein
MLLHKAASHPRSVIDDLSCFGAGLGCWLRLGLDRQSTLENKANLERGQDAREGLKVFLPTSWAGSNAGKCWQMLANAAHVRCGVEIAICR